MVVHVGGGETRKGAVVYGEGEGREARKEEGSGGVQCTKGDQERRRFPQTGRRESKEGHRSDGESFSEAEARAAMDDEGRFPKRRDRVTASSKESGTAGPRDGEERVQRHCLWNGAGVSSRCASEGDLRLMRKG